MISLLRYYIYITYLLVFFPEYSLIYIGKLIGLFLIIVLLCIISFLLGNIDKSPYSIITDNNIDNNELCNWYLIYFDYKIPFFKILNNNIILKTDIYFKGLKDNFTNKKKSFGYFSFWSYLLWICIIKIPLYYTILYTNYIDENRKILYFTAVWYLFDILHNFIVYINLNHKNILKQFIQNIFALSYNYTLLTLFVFFLFEDKPGFYCIQFLFCLSYDLTILLLIASYYLIVLLYVGVCWTFLGLYICLINGFYIISCLKYCWNHGCFIIDVNEENNNNNNNNNIIIDVNEENNNNNNIIIDVNEEEDKNNKNQDDFDSLLLTKINIHIKTNIINNINNINNDNNDDNIKITLDINELLDIGDNTYVKDISDIKNIDFVNFEEHIIELNKKIKCEICKKFNNKIIKTNKTNNNCVICMEEKTEILYLNCGHVLTCLECLIISTTI